MVWYHYSLFIYFFIFDCLELKSKSCWYNVDKKNCWWLLMICALFLALNLCVWCNDMYGFRSSYFYCTCCFAGREYTITFLRFCKQVSRFFLSVLHMDKGTYPSHIGWQTMLEGITHIDFVCDIWLENCYATVHSRSQNPVLLKSGSHR